MNDLYFFLLCTSIFAELAPWYLVCRQKGVKIGIVSASKTSWDELSSHQAEAVSLNLASRYGYITTINHGVGAIKAQVGFILRFDAISGNRENFDFNQLHQQFWGFLRRRGWGCTHFKMSFLQFFSPY